MVGLLIIYGGILLSVSGVGGSRRPYKKEDAGSVLLLGVVLETPLCLIVLQWCLCRSRCDI